MCLLTRGSRPSSARPGKIVLRDAIGLAVDLDREDSSFFRHLEQIGKDISFGVVDNILVIWSFDWILHLSWWSRRTLNHSGGNRYQWSCDLRSNDTGSGAKRLVLLARKAGPLVLWLLDSEQCLLKSLHQLMGTVTPSRVPIFGICCPVLTRVKMTYESFHRKPGSSTVLCPRRTSPT